MDRPARDPGFETIRLLLVDDDDRFVAALTALLESDGRFEIVGRARNGREAVELAAGRAPDVVLMDIEMPLMDGIEATRRICAGGATARVIALSATEDQERALEIRDAGAVDYLLKSRYIDELVKAVVTLVRQRRPIDGGLFVEVPVDPAATLTATLERRLTRLAYDLHDGALQEVAALAADLAAARQQILPVVSENSRGRVSGRLDDLKAQLTELDESLRSLVHTVRGGSDVSEALDTSIAREVAGLRDKIGVEAELEFVGSFAELTDSRRIAIIRIVKEALSNVREHSGARHVRIRVAEQNGRVEVSVEDDGRGFDFEPTLAIAQHDYRFGLIGMRDRVRLLGGELLIDTAPGRGTRLSFTLDPWLA